MFPQWHSRMSFSSPTLIPRCCITSTGQSWASWLDTTSNTSSSGTTWTSCSPAAPGSPSAPCRTLPDRAQQAARPLSSISLAEPRPVPTRRATSMFAGRATSLVRGRSLLRTPCHPLCSRRLRPPPAVRADDKLGRQTAVPGPRGTLLDGSEAVTAVPRCPARASGHGRLSAQVLMRRAQCRYRAGTARQHHVTSTSTHPKQTTAPWLKRRPRLFLSATGGCESRGLAFTVYAASLEQGVGAD